MGLTEGGRLSSVCARNPLIATKWTCHELSSTGSYCVPWRTDCGGAFSVPMEKRTLRKHSNRGINPMSNNLQNHVRSTIRRALYGTLGIPMLALPVALAQQATNQTAAATGEKPVKMEKTVVTGSLIPTAETVGPAPVDIVSAEKIQQVGSQDVLATLKALNASFSGNGNIGQSLNNGGYGESYIAIRNLPTLVLVDGQRLNISPFSTFVQTFAPDLNLIPVSMIDHIEVLKDGASTIYGSDAIGGVVN